MDKIIIFGGSGFIGRHLTNELINKYKVVIVSRHRRKVEAELIDKVTVVRLRRRDNTKLVEQIDGAKAVVNLAGENVGGRWTKSKMQKIRNSRLDTDSIIIRAILATKTKPKVVIQGSAIGIYGLSRNTIDITEETPLGKRGFLTKVALSHEEMFNQLESLARVVYIRTGLVLVAEDGALPKLAKQFNLYMGGKIGSGQQWNSWIHVDDEVKAIKYLIENASCSGAYNLTSPNPVRNKEFSTSLAKVLKRPSLFPAPAFAIRLFLGTMGNELLLSGLKVLPAKLQDNGYKFKYENLDEALENLYSNPE